MTMPHHRFLPDTPHRPAGPTRSRIGAGNGEDQVAYRTTEVLTPGRRVRAYASLVDNQAGDPTTILLLLPCGGVLDRACWSLWGEGMAGPLTSPFSPSALLGGMESSGTELMAAATIAALLMAAGCWYLRQDRRYRQEAIAEIEARKGLWNLVSRSMGMRYVSSRHFISWARIAGTVAVSLGIGLLLLVAVVAVARLPG